ncbi:MAG TPA: hypothetical protein VI894_03740 [Candidatus Nanoarchaeia archaeon]|nr:hypothetical protein [Candidatus Nanoarchaeia archaeon]
MKLSNKLLILIFVLSLGPLIILGSINFNRMSELFSSNTYETLHIISESKEHHIFEYIKFLELRADILSTDVFIQESLRNFNSSNQTNTIELNKYLIHKKENDKLITHIGITDMNGKVIASDDLRDISVDHSAEEYIRNAKTIVWHFDAYFPTELKETVLQNISQMPVSKIIVDQKTGEKLGILFYHVRLADIEDILAGERMHASTSAHMEKIVVRQKIDVYLVNREGFLITKSKNSNKIFKEKVDIPPVKKCLENSKEYAGAYNSFNNKTVMGVSVCIPEHKWTLVVETPQEDVFAHLKIIKNDFLKVELIIIIISVILGMLFYYFFIHKNLKKLTNFVDEISAGNVDAKHNITSKDEFENLANHFDKLKETLSTHIKADISKIEIVKKEKKSNGDKTKKESGEKKK